MAEIRFGTKAADSLRWILRKTGHLTPGAVMPRTTLVTVWLGVAGWVYVDRHFEIGRPVLVVASALLGWIFVRIALKLYMIMRYGFGAWDTSYFGSEDEGSNDKP